MTDELKPVRCGCGGEGQVLHPEFTHCLVVQCGKCGIRTPYMNSEAEAVTAWNRAMGGVVVAKNATTDLISKQDAIKALSDAHFKNYGNAIMVIQDLPSAEPERKTFHVIDRQTGREADPYDIALNEDWAKGLMYCDMEGFALLEDGTLMLTDECGRYEFPPDSDRFEIVWD